MATVLYMGPAWDDIARYMNQYLQHEGVWTNQNEVFPTAEIVWTFSKLIWCHFYQKLAHLATLNSGVWLLKQPKHVDHVMLSKIRDCSIVFTHKKRSFIHY